MKKQKYTSPVNFELIHRTADKIAIRIRNKEGLRNHLIIAAIEI